MSLINKEKIEKLEKIDYSEGKENGNSKSIISKELQDEKEDNESNLTNIKVFNGLIEGNNIFKTLNSNTNKPNNNTKNNNNKKEYIIDDNKVIDLNYISFGDCDNFFINNLNTKKNDEDKTTKKECKNRDKEKNKEKEKNKDKNSNHSKSKSKKNRHNHSKKKYEIMKDKNSNIKNIKIEKKYIEEILTNDNSKTTKTMSFNDPKEINEKKMAKNNITDEKIERKEKECKNYFKISSIKNGVALVVTGDDTVFTFPAYLLPKGAKLGESFTLDIKLYDINKNSEKEIEEIQKKYA